MKESTYEEPLMSLVPNSDFERLLWEKRVNTELRQKLKESEIKNGMLQSELDEMRDLISTSDNNKLQIANTNKNKKIKELEEVIRRMKKDRDDLLHKFYGQKKKENTITMHNLIIEFNTTGPCKVDVDKVVAGWSNEFSISRWHDDYRLIEGNSEDCAKVTITQEQAQEIISKANLLQIKDALFKNGSTYRSKENIESELKRLKDIKPTDKNQSIVLAETVKSYEAALL